MIANGNNTLTQCDYDSVSGNITGPCSVMTPPSGLPTGIYATSVVDTYQAQHTLWFTTPASNSVTVCPLIYNQGSGATDIGTCVDSGVGAIFNQPKGIYTADTYVLVANSGNNTISRCDNTNGVLSNCTTTQNGGFNTPTGITGSSGYIFTTNAGDDTVSMCDNLNGVLSNCNRMSYGFTAPKDILVGSCG